MKTIFERLNDTNASDYSNKTNGNFRRQLDKDITHNKMTSTNWESEAQYYNYTSNRTILKMNNKEWHKLTNNKYAR